MSLDTFNIAISLEENPKFIQDDNRCEIFRNLISKNLTNANITLNLVQQNMLEEFQDQIIICGKKVNFSQELIISLINIGNSLIRLLIDQTIIRRLEYHQIEENLTQLKLESINALNNSIKECINQCNSPITQKQLKQFLHQFTKQFQTNQQFWLISFLSQEVQHIDHIPISIEIPLEPVDLSEAIQEEERMIRELVKSNSKEPEKVHEPEHEHKEELTSNNLNNSKPSQASQLNLKSGQQSHAQISHQEQEMFDETQALMAELMQVEDEDLERIIGQNVTQRKLQVYKEYIATKVGQQLQELEMKFEDFKHEQTEKFLTKKK